MSKNKPDDEFALVSLDTIKNMYITEGLTSEEIAKTFSVSPSFIANIIETNGLEALKAKAIKSAMQKVQDIQINQAKKVMDIENGFKKLRLIQLENELNDYMVYFSTHGDFYRRNSTTGEILTDIDGFPIQLQVPNVAREINQLKESIKLSEGLKTVLLSIDDLLNKPRNEELPTPPDTFDVNSLFNKGKK